MLLRPLGLAHQGADLPVTAGCIVVLLVIFVADVVTPMQVAVSSLGLIPLLVAMWLLSGRLALAVGAVGVGQLIITGAAGALSPVTVASETAAYLLLAVISRLYAVVIANLLGGARSYGHPVDNRCRLRSEALAGGDNNSWGNGIEKLSRRERQVAQLAAQGYTARETGNELHIGKRTVETYLLNAYNKLGVYSKRELTRAVLRQPGEPATDSHIRHNWRAPTGFR